MCQPVTAQLRCVAERAPVDLNRSTNRPQFQVVADANSTPLSERFGQRDLQLSGHFRHEPIIALIKDGVKDLTLIRSRFCTGPRRRPPAGSK
jgi:hypothetical protein